MAWKRNYSLVFHRYVNSKHAVIVPVNTKHAVRQYVKRFGKKYGG